MKILAVADNEDKFIWDFFDPERFKDIDLIVSCGDLKSEYLEFLVTMIPVPLIYVHGNHDTSYIKKKPLGCVNIEDDIYVDKKSGLRFLGLGGSIRYRPEVMHQYTEQEMQKRIWKIKRKIRRFKGFDILVSHSPAYHIGDGEDSAHKGFECFIKLMDTYKPKYLLHGHQHAAYNRKMQKKHEYNSTTIINVGSYTIIDVDLDGK